MTPVWSEDLSEQAWQFACGAHRGQEMSGRALSFVYHVGQVAMEVMWSLARRSAVHDPDLAVQAAFLHDVLERTPCTYEELAAQFGTAVADGGVALSKNLELPSKDAQMQNSLERIVRQPKEIWMVKLADRISKLIPPPPDWTPQRIRQYGAEAEMIHERLQEADRLLAKIRAYRQYTNKELR
jgi:(p)ppGpp synthase/HD superfamily hydrolase